MKPSKPVKLNPKSKQFCYEVHALAEQAGLVNETPEYPQYFYWYDTLTKRKFRLSEGLMLEVSDNDFDRWANSGYTELPMPKTGDKFIKLIEELRYS